MKVLDLFSGIGGFSLGLDRAGFKTIAFCEIEEYPRSILKKHWPDVPIARDIRKLSYNKKTQELIYDGETIYVGSIEFICGGFPCQPFSVAGKQAGKEDDRHIWPEMFRLIQEIRPTWVIGENVAGFIKMALDDVLYDLESEGYACQTFVIPACAVGAIHRRDRVWIVAHTNSIGLQGSEKKGDICKNRQEPNDEQSPGCDSPFDTGREDVTNPAGCRQPGSREHGESINTKKSETRQAINVEHGSQGFIGIPTQPQVRHRDDGIPDNMARLKALGNAVVPQIPEMIGRAIMEASK